MACFHQLLFLPLLEFSRNSNIFVYVNSNGDMGSKKKRTEYFREYMRQYREGKKHVLIDEKTLKQLKNQFPSAYELIFGKKKRRR